MKYKKTLLLLTILISTSVYGESDCRYRRECDKSDHYHHDRHYDKHRHDNDKDYHQNYDERRYLPRTRPPVRIAPRQWNPQY